MSDIPKGESKYVEFKAFLPKKSETYVKSIIAFANTGGGCLYIGIEDGTGNIIGVSKDDVFRIMDSIANAVSDSCEPQILPDITFQTINGKCIVIVEIYPGEQRPYYLKRLGKERGTYIRVAGTSRPADTNKIKELELEGRNESWDELAYVGYTVTDEAIQRLCRDMQYYIDQSRVELSSNVAHVTVQQLVNWGVLKQRAQGLIATNAFVLLTSDVFRFSRIQCALFKGMDRDEFIDKKECTGPLYKQIEEAYQFVLRHINKGAIIDGLVRQEQYELPISAIREMIINAVCHRNYMDPSSIQVALYDDRLEVTSPGMLFGGLTLKEAMSGRSKIRNRVVAEVFSAMELIEEWGTGIRRIIKRAKEYGLPEPKFIEIEDTFRVNLYKKTDKKPIEKADKKPIEKADKKPIREERKQKIINYIQSYGKITNSEARNLIGLAESTTKRLLKEMVHEGVLQEKGNRKSRVYLLP